MRDLLVRLQNALPQGEAVDREHTYNPPGRINPGKRAWLRSAGERSACALLRNAFAAITPAMPFPPVLQYGLPEFQQIALMPMDGITFGNVYFVRHGVNSVEELHFHELIHVIQWGTLGFDQFLLTYALGIAQYGYEHSPLEAMAYELQGRFRRGEEIRDVVQ